MSVYTIIDVTTEEEIGDGGGKRVNVSVNVGDTVLNNNDLFTVVHVMHVIPYHSSYVISLWPGPREYAEICLTIIFVKPVDSDYDDSHIISVVKRLAAKYADPRGNAK